MSEETPELIVKMEKIAAARAKLAELKILCKDPEVRSAICSLFWEAEDPENCADTAEELHDNNYSHDEPVEVMCAVSLDNFYIHGGGTDDDDNERPYIYENT